MNFKHIRTVLNILLDLAIVLSVHMMFLFFYVLVTILLQKIDYLFSCELYIDFGLLKIGNFTAVLKNIFGGGGELCTSQIHSFISVFQDTTGSILIF